MAAYRQAIEIDPQQYRNYRALGDFYVQQARYYDALEQFRKALPLAPNDPDLGYRLGLAFQDIGEFASAEKEIRASLRAAETPVGLHTLGVLLIYERRYREAVSNISRALHLGHEQSLWWMNLGTAYRKLNLHSESTHAYRRALELVEMELTDNPRDAFSRGCLAYLYAQQNDYNIAASEAVQAMKESPKNADVLWMAAVTYEALGRRVDTLSILATSPPGVLEDLSRWPDVADLHHDSRFLQLLASH